MTYSSRYKFKEGELLKQNERNFRHFDVIGHGCIRSAALIFLINEKMGRFIKKSAGLLNFRV